MSVLGWVGVFLLGGAGAVARFAVGVAVTARARSDLPVGTLVVNVTGALVVGVLAGLTLSADTALLLGTATIGSYTTFSAWLFETHRLAVHGRRRWAAANIGVSLLLGVGAVLLGRAVGGAL